MSPYGLSLETFELGKRFGSFAALRSVSVKVAASSLHALLGENGAGKSTLVKCVAGYHQADEGSLLIDGREQVIDHPAAARRLGIGMVYQHFTVAPGMTVAENLLMAGGRLPMVIDWPQVRRELQAFMEEAPFRLDLHLTPAQLSAGEKQKLEILKQLYLKPRLLILDEPTSVLTPQEADEVLQALRQRCAAGQTTVLMITHKFREVMAYADDVSVLRRGQMVHAGPVSGSDAAFLAAAMVGETQAVESAQPAIPTALGSAASASPKPKSAAPELLIQGLQVLGDRGDLAVRGVDLAVRGGEIVGVAGVSGNGQRELMEALFGQRPRAGGRVLIGGQDYRATRAQNRSLRVRGLPEEPLRNACVAGMSVADNISLRIFDEGPMAGLGLRRFGQVARRASALTKEFAVKLRSEREPIAALSGGNVQRAVLARELSEASDVLLVSNPAFGLDFTAVAEVHRRLRDARHAGTAVLMVSEDLDELLTLADRIVVMSEGRIVHHCAAKEADRMTIGRFMGGQDLTLEPIAQTSP
ncbi:MAG: ABC transporter ATP-binding protein [Betaproteobacteria bacterium]|nr:ABC transporter ATP-binding protein [Betaproteobacteria bacterium]